MYIIGTVGPMVKDRSILKGIVDNGVNALRLNFAHGSQSEFKEFLNMANELGKNIDIILDLSGSKIRISNKFEYIFKVYDNEEIYFCGEDIYDRLKKRIPKNKSKLIPLNIKNNLLLGKQYSNITIKDNTMLFEILEEKDVIKAKTIKGGIIRKGKGCNIKELNRTLLPLSENDKIALEWGIKNRVNIISQSFVENKEDICEIKQYLKENSRSNFKPKIWAKIETTKGIENINSILKEVDGIIIGRGDMIPETSIEDTPIYEDRIIKAVKSEGNKDIIVATHIFNSMKSGKVPSICEVESIYNFIKSGVTGFLLAGETSVGKAPIKTVQFLNELIKKYTT